MLGCFHHVIFLVDDPLVTVVKASLSFLDYFGFCDSSLLTMVIFYFPFMCQRKVWIRDIFLGFGDDFKEEDPIATPH